MTAKNTSYYQKPSHGDEVFFKILNESLSRLKVPVKISKEKAWENLTASIEKQTSKVINHSFTIKIMAVAASLIVAVFTCLYYIHTEPVLISCKNGEMRTLILPDSSVVYLNAVSNLSYSENKWDKKRDVYLEGEACFEVRKGKTFTVKTINGDVKVLGTRFNVSSRGSDFKVFCATGKVSVKKGKEVTLVTGQECLSIDNSTITEPLPVDGLKPIGWIHGEFWFSNTPLSKVFEELERQFEVNIIYNKITNRYYTGYFNKNNLEGALKNICKPMSLKYEIISNNIIIKNEF